MLVSSIELRSDTFTRPTDGMKAAMMTAEVGDDVWGEDPSVRDLEAYTAALFGKEAAVFCPSGTMTNQIALGVYLRPGDEVICADVAHIHLYEGGGIAANSGASTQLMSSDRGRFTSKDVEAVIKPEDHHAPSSKLVALEDTCNRGGGSVWDSVEVEAIAELCRERGLGLHLDGARLMNRLVARGDDPALYARNFDSISLCLSKGLGAPVGSLLLGTAPFIERARRLRKRMGGGMRQAGFLAAAGRYALEHNVERLGEDHHRAQVLAEALHASPYVLEVLPTETNIVLFQPRTGEGRAWLDHLEQDGVRAASMGAWIRFVTHLDVSDADIARVSDSIARFRC